MLFWKGTISPFIFLRTNVGGREARLEEKQSKENKTIAKINILNRFI
jgi:hypothetical protein